MNERDYYIYIMASKKNGTIYIGVTSNLIARVYQHKQSKTPCFTQRCKVHALVYYEITNHIYEAITRDKQLKKWTRAWKIRLIEKNNPNWDDLYPILLG